MIADFSSERVNAKIKWHNIFQMLKHRTVNPEFCIQQNYASGMKGKSRHSQMQKT